MSEVHDLLLPPAHRAGVSKRRPTGPVLTIHPGGRDTDGLVPTADVGERPLQVYVYAKDAILRAGIAAQLRRSPDVVLADEYRPDASGVAIVVTDELGEEVDTAIRAVRRSCTPRIMVVTNRLTRSGVDSAVASGARIFIRRSEARPERLAEAVRHLANSGDAPKTVDECLGNLVGQVEDDSLTTVRPRPAGLNDRDMEVLRLMADGHSTAGIARDLAYSESTIKNIIHAIVRELGARNRAHAVAMALRSQMI
jgi:DNA-binding NarL/FixJ family response regulator